MAIRSTELALLHHLETAAKAHTQLPKHVAHELEQQGLVRTVGTSPGQVELTEAGEQRLKMLSAAGRAGDVLP